MAENRLKTSEGIAARIRQSAVAELAIAVLLAMPLLWVLAQVAIHARQIAWGNLLEPLAALCWRTLFYDLLVTAIAFVLAIPAAVSLGRSGAVGALATLGVLLVAFLQPPVVYLYGWSQFFSLIGWNFEPQSSADVLRCIWTLACWLWPIPAAALGLSLRALNRDIIDAARLDGGEGRIRLGHLLAPAVGAAAVTLAMALQQFTVFEQTNILVVATEVRTVFAMGSLGAVEILTTNDQAARVAAAAAVGLPVVIAIVALAGLARMLLSGRAVALAAESGAAKGRYWPWPTAGVLLMALGVPLAAMYLALANPAGAGDVLLELWPQFSGSLLVAGCVSAICFAIGCAATAWRLRWVFAVSLLSFLAGGQLLALGAIHLLNRPALEWLYDSAAGVIVVHAAMFCWIGILPSRIARGGVWTDLRSAAASDGASGMQTFARVILPATWAWHLAAAMIVFCMSFGEIPAVMLMQPQRPQMLLPMLMTWVHMLRYDAMIHGALLLSGLVLAVAGAVAAMVVIKGRLETRRG